MAYSMDVSSYVCVRFSKDYLCHSPRFCTSDFFCHRLVVLSEKHRHESNRGQLIQFARFRGIPPLLKKAFALVFM